MEHGKLTVDDVRFHKTWRASSGHPKGWRVTRYPLASVMHGTGYLEEHSSKRGTRILYKSRESAQRKADTLNRE